MALVSHLAYWTNGNAYRMDRLFRQSGLMRVKWDTMHGSQTYSDMTISKTLSSFSPYASSFAPRKNPDNQDSSTNTQENTPSSAQTIEDNNSYS